ncbi:hypothetical protein [Mesorhizobium sp.]|uniref:hypothetical protein n=1 Tax=Mesorhizobium sp. TaxID=1871066 RepID=UPI00121C1BB3|nr:hypothetical protein [Mesorhizobium sp.]TIO61836.1 MAG: hypothetical protein E5X79_05565 [Mesorhizobium sp.]
MAVPIQNPRHGIGLAAQLTGEVGTKEPFVRIGAGRAANCTALAIWTSTISRQTRSGMRDRSTPIRLAVLLKKARPERVSEGRLMELTALIA